MVYFKYYLIIDKFLKLNIKGDMDKMIDMYIELICFSNLILVFVYYLKFVFLFYIWFVNNIKMDGEID